MLLRNVYDVKPSSSNILAQVQLPLMVQLAADVTACLEVHADELRLVLERTVDVGDLEVVRESGWHRKLPDGRREPLPRLRIRNDKSSEHVLATTFVNAITFLIDVPLTLSRRELEERFIAENGVEEDALKRFGTDERYHETGVRLRTRTLSVVTDSDAVEALLDRATGLRLYDDAIKLTLEVAQFRELWRVLESAFGRSNHDLVVLLAGYKPARDMGFDESELESLCVLRGRASHAASKGGLDEVIRVERSCGEQLGRLKNLVERVVVTKKSWGYPTVEVHELTSLRAYIGLNGEQHYLSRPTRPAQASP